MDYHAIKSIILNDKYPITVVKELLVELSKAIIFSKLDLRFGYHQIQVKRTDTPKTTFQTPEGLLHIFKKIL